MTIFIGSNTYVKYFHNIKCQLTHVKIFYIKWKYAMCIVGIQDISFKENSNCQFKDPLSLDASCKIVLKQAVSI